MPTVGDTFRPVVTPRRFTWPCPTPLLVNDSPGTVAAKSDNWVAPVACNVSPVSTDRDSGVSLARSSRFWAVTITSMSWVAESGDAPAIWADAGSPPKVDVAIRAARPRSL